MIHAQPWDVPVMYLVQAAFLATLAGAVSWVVMRSYSEDKRRVPTLARVLAMALLLFGVGMGAGVLFVSIYPPAFAIVAIGILTFFELLYNSLQGSQNAPIQDRDLRIAITGSVTTMYLALVGYGAFMRIPLDQREAPMAQALVTSFTAVMSVVIAFYFGTSAYLERRNEGPRPQGPRTESTPSSPTVEKSPTGQ